MEDIKQYIRNVPDFPKKGIVFRDITTLVSNGAIFKKTIDTFWERYKAKKSMLLLVLNHEGLSLVRHLPID